MTTGFVGRERELDELRTSLAEASEGRGRLFLISGEPGIGKTRLAEELGAHARAGGAKVVWGRCWEGDGAPPFWPWVQVIRGLAGEIAPAEIAARMGSGADYVAHLVPELVEKLGVERPTSIPSSESPNARFFLFDAAARFCKEAARVAPLVVIVDDLHWADKPPLLLLEFLGRALGDAPILVIATYREVETRQPGPLRDGMATLARLGRPIPLRGLREVEVGLFMKAISDKPPATRLVAAVHRATDGNPFFVDEIVRLLAAEGIEAPTRGSLPIPDSVRAVIRRRLKPLRKEARKVLEAASVVGRGFDIDVLEHVAGVPRKAIELALGSAMTAGLVNRGAATSTGFSFAHALFRDTLYGDLHESEQRRLHGMAGRALEDAHGNDLEPHLSELAHHFLLAAEANRARDYSIRAAHHAKAMHAYEEAADHIECALGLIPERDRSERLELLVLCGDMHALSGNYPASIGTLRKAADVARRLGDSETFARAALAGELSFGIVPQRIRLLEEALELLPRADHLLRARVMAQLAVALVYQPDTGERAAAIADEAVAMAKRLGEPRGLAETMLNRVSVLWNSACLRERPTPPFEEEWRIVSQLGDAMTAARLHAAQSRAFFILGDVRAARREADAVLTIANAMHHTGAVAVGRQLQVSLMCLEGRFAESERELLDLLTPRHLGDFHHYTIVRSLQIFLLRKQQGRLEEFAEELEEAAASFSGRIAVAWRCASVLLRSEIGQDAEARRELASLAADDVSNVPRGGNWTICCMAWLAESCWLLQDSARASPLYEALVPYATQVVVTGAGASSGVWGSVSYYLGLLASTMSQLEASERHFEFALALHERMGASPWVARTQFAYAKMLLARGAHGDLEKGRTLLSDARTIADRLEMKKLGADASSGLRAEAREALPDASLFACEGDYWTIAYEKKAFRLKDSKGLGYLRELLRNPGRALYVLDLATGSSIGSTEAAVDLGDAGAALDAKAKSQYRRRLQDLRAEAEEAERFNETERAARAREQMALIAAELARATGLGGRDRRSGSAPERARLNVTMAVKATLKRIAQNNPPLGRHLDATIRTGRFCSYTPDRRPPVDWKF